MNKKTVIAMWSVNILLYIVNIIIVCVGGSTIFNNVMAWALAIFLVLVIIYLEIKIINLQEINKLLLNYHFENFQKKLEETQKALNKDFIIEGAEHDQPQTEDKGN